MTEAYFFDTYAILEIIAGNPAYKKYTGVEIVLTKLNLFEIFYIILKENLENAGLLKKSHPKLSMADCIGYITALNNGVKFLTGDKEFENMPHVEFVR